LCWSSEVTAVVDIQLFNGTFENFVQYYVGSWYIFM